MLSPKVPNFTIDFGEPNKIPWHCQDLVKVTLFIYLLFFSLLVKKFEFPAQSSVLTKANKIQIS